MAARNEQQQQELEESLKESLELLKKLRGE
jgi:hypothetical protein